MNTGQDPKKIVLINTVLYGSTGNIVRQLKSLAEKKGMQAYTVSAYARNSTTEYGENDSVIGNYFDRYLHIWLSRVTGLSGVFSVYSTLKLTRRFKRIRPDVIHLHNLHNAYINLPILFRYIKKNNVRVIWTLHDCWAFTGRCPHFQMYECNKWMTGCFDCPYPDNEYPIANRDGTKKMWNLKKRTFTGVKDMTIVTPSGWLSGLVRQSFLGNYPVKVINNGIDLDTFRPSNGQFYDDMKALGKHIVLGLAMDWNKRKGLDVFIELNKMLGDDYRIVLVGTDDALAEELDGSGIICINRTSSQKELAELYTAADVFANPTREDTFPTVNIEALACGTPVITFDTGGSPEIPDDTCGIVIPKEDIEAMKQAIISICEEKKISSGDCNKRAQQFDRDGKFNEYIKLY